MTLRTVLRNEWRLLRADRALAVVLGVFALLFAYALANGLAWVDFQEETLAAAREGNAERVETLEAELQRIADGGQPSSPFRDPRSPSVLGGPSGAQTAVLDPGPLTALAVGQSDLLPYYYDVSIRTNESSFLQNGEIENPLNLLVGRFDLAFVVVYLLPLLILALSFNVLSGEREQGTLALTLAQPVSARGVVSAKLAFRAILESRDARSPSAVVVAHFPERFDDVIVRLTSGTQSLERRIIVVPEGDEPAARIMDAIATRCGDSLTDGTGGPRRCHLQP